MRNPWVIAVIIFSFVLTVALMVAAAVGLEAVKSDQTDVLLPALIAFGGVSLTLLASTLIPTLIKAGSTEAAAQKAADNSEETKRIAEEVRHEVNGNLTKRLKAANEPLERKIAALIQANQDTQERLSRGDLLFDDIRQLLDALRTQQAATNARLDTITSCDVQPEKRKDS